MEAAHSVEEDANESSSTAPGTPATAAVVVNTNVSGLSGRASGGRICAVTKLVLSAAQTLLAFSASITCFVLKYYEAGVWLFGSFLMGAMALNLNYRDWQSKLSEYYNTMDLTDLQRLGLMFTFAGFTGTMWYLFRYVYQSIPVVPMELVGSLMTCQLGGMLVYYTYSYEDKMLVDELLER